MSSSNHVSSLLANEKLTGENYMKWKSNLNIVLICENHKFVLTAKTAREKFDNWILSNNKAKCYMLASMSDVLRKKIENTENAYDIWDSLQDMFGQQSNQCSHETTISYMTKKMKK